jgi:transcriptional regulator with PAS, ATPase and Fis domain
MSPNLQAKLLRVLQDGTFIPVGDTRERKVDVRIVAATNKDLKKLISENKFRDDLYYRICGVHVSLPPLRERREDIPALVDHFIKISPHAKTAKTVSPEALNALTAFEWPGNIRQLQNEVERMVVLSGEAKVIGVDLLSPEVAGSMNPKVEGALAFDSSGGSLKDAVQAIERRMIEEALIKANGNKSEAARELGISRSNLIAKVQEYGIS